MVRRVITIIITVLFAASVLAQTPQKMSYQAVIRDAGGELVISSNIGMRISILQESTTGTAVYVETQTPTSNANGLVTIEVGGGTPITGTFSGIVWSNGTYYIKTEIDPAGGATYSIEGTTQILSVPYALYSKTAETSSESDGLRQQIKILEDNLIAAGTYKLADVDGNQYGVVKIGTQVWMAENLKSTKYNDGTVIPNVTVDATWAALTTGAYCDYDNTPSNATTYGRLYNWYAVDNNAATKVASNGGKNVCPTSWHVPSDAEWTTLTDYLGGEAVAGDKLKETGLTHWIDPNTGATNETGFTALPGGYRYRDGTYYANGYNGLWWSSTEHSTTIAWGRTMDYTDADVYRGYYDWRYGFSVRCVRDF